MSRNAIDWSFHARSVRFLAHDLVKRLVRDRGQLLIHNLLLTQVGLRSLYAYETKCIRWKVLTSSGLWKFFRFCSIVDPFWGYLISLRINFLFCGCWLLMHSSESQIITLYHLLYTLSYLHRKLFNYSDRLYKTLFNLKWFILHESFNENWRLTLLLLFNYILF